MECIMNSLSWFNTIDEEEGKSRENSKEETCWKRVFNQNRRRFPVGVNLRVKIFIVLLIIQVSLLDPLFFYIPVINDRQKCVRLDKKLGTAVMVFRSLIDSFYVIYIIVELHKHFLVVRRTGKYQYIRLGKFFLIDFLAVLPLPQVVILIFIPAMRGSRFLNAMYLLRSVVLCQFVPRSFRAYLFITSGTFGVPAKARVKFSPLIFLLGIDVIGTFWYFLSVERLVQCWTKACKTHVGCVNSFYCKDNIGDHTSLNDLCRRDGQKTDFFDFGIFSNALQHRVLEMTYFPKKLLYCFQWSLQNLSGFGQNLQTSTYIWENLFAISMSILGMLLFLFLIGNLQAFIESQRKDEREKKRWQAIESIEKWPPLEKLSVNLKQDIKKYLKYYWEKNTIDAVMILLELPTNLRKSVECALGLELLKKVKAFKGIGQNLLDYLSKSTELKLFDEGECIVEEGKTINEMVFIVLGKLEARSFLDDIKSINILEDGDLYGEEVTWDIFFNYRMSYHMTVNNSYELCVTPVTIKALTRVHALILSADEVRNFLHRHPDDLKRSVRHELCFDFLKKVKMFKHIGQNELDDLSESIEMMIFDEGEDIVVEGKTINDMVFIVHGKLEARSSLDDINSINVLQDGDLCGEEVTWYIFLNCQLSSELWVSPMTVKALTRVHALVLSTNKIIDFRDRLPDELKKSVRHELCFDFLKEVKAFKHIGENKLDDLSESIELKLFDEGESIVEEGKTINDMVFILHGKLEARSSLNDINPINVLKKGDLCGEEVVLDICFSYRQSYELWVSPVTVKALRRVQALVLSGNGVRNFFHRHPDDLKRSVRHELCFDFLKKVKAFKGIGQNLLDYLSKTIKLKLVNEGECIVEEEKTINDMVFIMHGRLEVRSSLDDINTKYVIKDGDLCGEEVTWDIFLNYRLSSEHWLSHVTVKALTRVHALVLPIDKVRFSPSPSRQPQKEPKVKAFKHIGQNELDDLSESIELKLFNKGEYIVEKGKTINDMVFIVLGKLEAFSNLDDRNPINVLKDVDLCGEEVTWDIFFDYRLSFDLWVSLVTIKSFTRVHALVLPADKVRDFLRRLPDDLQRSVRHDLYFVFLKKVKAFKYMNQNDLDDLYESFELKLFDEGKYIVEEGQTINELVFIVHGKLGASSSLDPINALKDGGICGEEVLWEAFNDQSLSYDLWESTVTIKAHTRVHALVLPAYIVRDFLHRLPEDLKRSVWRELKFVFLKKVKVLKHIGQNELDDLSGSIQMKLFHEGEYIVEEGKTINDIVFIVHGKLEAHSSLRDYLLIDGDICGEVVARNGFIGDWSSDQLPLSTVTMKAATRVHALVLAVQRVRDFLHRLPDDLQRNIRLEL